MNEPLLQEGLNLLLYGMGTVIVFLTLLVAVTVLMSTLIKHFSPTVDEPQALTQQDASPVDDRVQAIIQQAINQHRHR